MKNNHTPAGLRHYHHELAPYSKALWAILSLGFSVISLPQCLYTYRTPKTSKSFPVQISSQAMSLSTLRHDPYQHQLSVSLLPKTAGGSTSSLLTCLILSYFSQVSLSFSPKKMASSCLQVMPSYWPFYNSMQSESLLLPVSYRVYPLKV